MLEQAWQARKQIGPVVADDLRRRAHMRNEAARAIGFADYFALLLKGAGLTVFITIAGIALAVLLGLPLATARLWTRP